MSAYDAGTAKHGDTDFYADLDRSHADESLQIVEKALRDNYPDYLNHVFAHEDNDRLGVDVWIEQRNGVMSSADLKFRSKDFGDVALEIVAGDRPGWAVDPGKLNDDVVVIFKDSTRSVRFNTEKLRMAVAANLPRWRKLYREIRNVTRLGRTTFSCISICVPQAVIEAACASMMI